MSVKAPNIQNGLALQSSIAMIMTLVSFSMLFATLFLGYVAYRFTADVWPPMGMQRASLLIPTISTFTILLSSLSYFALEKSVFNKDWKKAKAYFYLTLTLGSCFMGFQFLLWRDLKLTGIFVDSTVFGSIIYAFTWIHAAHVVAGMLALLFLIPAIHQTIDEEKGMIRTKSVGQFWHFLGIVWFLIFFGIFVF